MYRLLSQIAARSRSNINVNSLKPISAIAALGFGCAVYSFIDRPDIQLERNDDIALPSRKLIARQMTQPAHLNGLEAKLRQHEQTYEMSKESGISHCDMTIVPRRVVYISFMQV